MSIRDDGASEGLPPILYIAGYYSPELDITRDFLRQMFGRKVIPFMWDVQHLAEWLFEIKPCCIVFSPPLEGVVAPFSPNEEVWKFVRQKYPDAPALWLSQNKMDVPTFLPKRAANFDAVQTEMRSGLLQMIVFAVARLAGITPRRMQN